MHSSDRFNDKLVLDQKIKELSSSSALAPRQFLEPELRRTANTCMAIFSGTTFTDASLEIFKQDLEEEYLCYFAPETFLSELNKKRTKGWQIIYAGCNAQIEGFLCDHNLGETLEKLGFGEQIAPVKQIPKSELNKSIRKYLQGIGYLFPSGENLLVHPNMLYAQLGRSHGKDSPFLTRDLIRCPYHVCTNPFHQLKEEEFWDYWKDLVSLVFTDFPERKLYSSENFHGKRDALTQQCLDLGQKLVPARYLELQPKIEPFEWIDG